MQERLNMQAVAQDTIKISEDGKYIIGNRQYSFDNSINTKLYKEEDFDGVIEKVKSNGYLNESPMIECRNEGTVDAVFRLSQGKKDLSLGILNFASAHNPGGGFQGGAMAQEECLAYCSDLYRKQINGDGIKYYEINRNFNSVLYTDTMIMSDVTFFKNSRYNLVSNPTMCKVLTAPAVNMGAFISRGGDVLEGNKVMKERMRKLLYVFANEYCTTIVLGAFGCGVFGNKAIDVAQFWKELLIEEGIQKYFNKVVFSVYDRPGRESNLSVFEKMF